MRIIKKLYKLSRLLVNPVYRGGLMNAKVAAAIEHEPMLAVHHFKTLVDVGANKGQFSMAFNRFNHASNIHAFEPLEEPAARFQKVFKSNSLVKLYPFAISNAEGAETIHVSCKEDSSSLLPIGDLQKEIFPGTGESHTQTIQTTVLASVVAKEEIHSPALLKLDVQGFELTALQGCNGYIDMFDNIYVECSFIELYEGQSLVHEVIDHLHSKNFKLTAIYNLHYDDKGQAVQADFLFSHSKV